ncbi:hypothetical protein TNCV_4217251 [Trichonephila clavipes]|nr:hypothetical protein TNCV_4217251 [Trichonephila clavipes]
MAKSAVRVPAKQGKISTSQYDSSDTPDDICLVSVKQTDFLPEPPDDSDRCGDDLNQQSAWIWQILRVEFFQLDP